MNELVLDASVILKWFAGTRERGARQAAALRTDYEAGRLAVLVPSLIFLEILNVTGRRWGWDEDGMAQLAAALDDLGFDVADPDLAGVAAWVARGLTAYDAAYVALAEEAGTQLVSDDAAVLSRAGDLARPLSS